MELLSLQVEVAAVQGRTTRAVKMIDPALPSLGQCSEAAKRGQFPEVLNTRVHTTSSSPSASKVDGSGIGPSMTHLLDSYFVLMKFSILLVALSKMYPVHETRKLLTLPMAHAQAPALLPSTLNYYVSH